MKTLNLKCIEHKCLLCKNIYLEKGDKLPEGIHFNLSDFICEKCIKKILERQYNALPGMRKGIISKKKKHLLEIKMICWFLNDFNLDFYLVKIPVFRHYFPIITKDSFLLPVLFSERPYRENIPKRLRERILKEYNYECCFCGSTKDLQIDHIKPVRKGGGAGESNLQVLCKICNIKKGVR